jgi:hypothetical protein
VQGQCAILPLAKYFVDMFNFNHRGLCHHLLSSLYLPKQVII